MFMKESLIKFNTIDNIKSNQIEQQYLTTRECLMTSDDPNIQNNHIMCITTKIMDTNVENNQLKMKKKRILVRNNTCFPSDFFQGNESPFHEKKIISKEFNKEISLSNKINNISNKLRKHSSQLLNVSQRPSLCQQQSNSISILDENYPSIINFKHNDSIGDKNLSNILNHDKQSIIKKINNLNTLDNLNKPNIIKDSEEKSNYLCQQKSKSSNTLPTLNGMLDGIDLIKENNTLKIKNSETEYIQTNLYSKNYNTNQFQSDTFISNFPFSNNMSKYIEENNERISNPKELESTLIRMQRNQKDSSNSELSSNSRMKNINDLRLIEENNLKSNSRLILSEGTNLIPSLIPESNPNSPEKVPERQAKAVFSNIQIVIDGNSKTYSNQNIKPQKEFIKSKSYGLDQYSLDANFDYQIRNSNHKISSQECQIGRKITPGLQLNVAKVYKGSKTRKNSIIFPMNNIDIFLTPRTKSTACNTANNSINGIDSNLQDNISINQKSITIHNHSRKNSILDVSSHKILNAEIGPQQSNLKLNTPDDYASTMDPLDENKQKFIRNACTTSVEFRSKIPNPTSVLEPSLKFPNLDVNIMMNNKENLTSNQNKYWNKSGKSLKSKENKHNNVKPNTNSVIENFCQNIPNDPRKWHKNNAPKIQPITPLNPLSILTTSHKNRINTRQILAIPFTRKNNDRNMTNNQHINYIETNPVEIANNKIDHQNFGNSNILNLNTIQSILPNGTSITPSRQMFIKGISASLNNSPDLSSPKKNISNNNGLILSKNHHKSLAELHNLINQYEIYDFSNFQENKKNEPSKILSNMANCQNQSSKSFSTSEIDIGIYRNRLDSDNTGFERLSGIDKYKNNTIDDRKPSKQTFENEFNCKYDHIQDINAQKSLLNNIKQRIKDPISQFNQDTNSNLIKGLKSKSNAVFNLADFSFNKDFHEQNDIPNSSSQFFCIEGNDNPFKREVANFTARNINELNEPFQQSDLIGENPASQENAKNKSDEMLLEISLKNQKIYRVKSAKLPILLKPIYKNKIQNKIQPTASFPLQNQILTKKNHKL